MGNLQRSDFSAGWQPSSDGYNAPKNALLRMDNLTLDQTGAVALRQGSVKINSAALSSTNCHSLFTMNLSGTRHRMTGATDAVFDNGTSIKSSLNGSGDIFFGAHMGQILFTRGTSHWKYDGTTVRTWGIAAPNAAPTLAVLAADSKTFASCDSGESPGMTQNEGTQSFAADRNGNANSAVQIIPDSTTGRGTSTLTFAGATDFTTYTGGQTGVDTDVIDFYAYVTEPQYLDTISLMIDVNDGTFQLDWFQFDFKNGAPIEVATPLDASLDSSYDVEGVDRDGVLARTVDRQQIVSSFRVDKPVANAGWNHFSVSRGQMERHGLTAGQDWNTVRAVRVTFVGLSGGSGAAVRFDQIQIVGGSQRALTGAYKVAIVGAYNSGTYVALSPPSAFSAQINLLAQGITVTVPSGVVSALDSQVNEIWFYIMGGTLDGFYRAAILTGGPFSGAQTKTIFGPDTELLIANLRMQTDNQTPPNTIIGICGPHYDRTLALTATSIYPSRNLNPDSFSTGQAITVGDATETALWLHKLNEQVWLGTTRDVYRMDGDWTEQPDGTINVTKHPMNVTHPPVDSAVAVGTLAVYSGFADSLIYRSSSGWQVLGGDLLVAGSVDLLWRGYTRHGVAPVNVTDSTSRFRCAISKNVLFAITPESTDNVSSAVLHVYHFSKQRWYRFTYPQNFVSIYAEPDGTIIAGDTAGFVRQMDLATNTDDGVNIPVVIRTPIDDDGSPFTYKQATNLQLNADMGLSTATCAIAMHTNGSDTASTTLTAAAGVSDATACSQFSQLQLRITGSFSTFILRGFAVPYRDNPMPLLVHDTNYVDLVKDGLAWVRRILIKANSASTMTVQPYWNGEPATVRTVAAGGNGNVKIYECPLGREDKGSSARCVITTTVPSQIYWIEFQFNDSGTMKQKRVSLVPAPSRSEGAA